MSSLLQAEKEASNTYKARYEAAEAQISQLREESEKLRQDIESTLAKFENATSADKGSKRRGCITCRILIHAYWSERIKELEEQLQMEAVKSTRDKEETHRQSRDAKAALAAREELLGM